MPVLSTAPLPVPRPPLAPASAPAGTLPGSDGKDQDDAAMAPLSHEAQIEPIRLIFGDDVARELQPVCIVLPAYQVSNHCACAHRSDTEMRTHRLR